jgi:hypothetical protein
MMFDRDINGKAMVDFVQDGKGVLTSSGCSATAFISTSYAKNEGESSWPDIQLIFLGNAIYRFENISSYKDFVHKNFNRF